MAPLEANVTNVNIIYYRRVSHCLVDPLGDELGIAVPLSLAHAVGSSVGQSLSDLSHFATQISSQVTCLTPSRVIEKSKQNQV